MYNTCMIFVYCHLQVVAPVRATTAQVLGVVSCHLQVSVVERVVSLLLVLAGQEQWEVRHASLMGVQHLLAARSVSISTYSSHTHTYTHTHTHTHTHTRTHTHVHTRTCTHTRTHTYTHVHIQTLTHTHMHSGKTQ